MSWGLLGPLSAWGFGIVGVTLGVVVGKNFLGWELATVFKAHLMSNLSGLVALFSVTRLQWRPGVKRHLLNGIASTWRFFLAVYYGGLLILTPELRDWRAFLLMVVPLAFGNALCTIVFGPIQDRLIARAQKRGS